MTDAENTQPQKDNTEMVLGLLKINTDMIQSALDRVSKLESSLSSFQTVVVNGSEAMAALLVRVNALGEQCSQTNALCLTVSDRISSLENSYGSHLKEYAEIDRMVKDVIVDHNTTKSNISKVSGDISDIHDKVLSLNTDVTTAKNTVEDNAASANIIRRDFNEMSKQFAALQNSAVTVRALLDTNALQRSAITNQVNEMHGKLIQTDADAKSLKPLIEELSELCRGNEEKIHQTNRNLDTHTQAINELSVLIKTISSNINNLDSNDKNLETRMSDRINRISGSVLALTEAMKKIDARVNEIPQEALSTFKKMLEEEEKKADGG